jgi:hypothetical protein
MKLNIVTLSVLFAFCLASCKKKEDGAASTYQLSNLSDQLIINNQSLNWEIPVELKSGSQEKVTMFMTDLPPNVSLLIDTISGLPPFRPTFTMKAQYATPGSYTIGVNTSSASLTSKKYDIKLTVKPSPECGTDLVGSYPETRSFRNGIVIYPASGFYTATINHTTKNKVTINCTCKVSYTVTADINCDQGTFNIPLQTVGYKIKMSGSGTIYPDSCVVLRYNYVDSFNNTTTYYIDELK